MCVIAKHCNKKNLQSLIVKTEGAIGVLQKGMSRKHRVVRLHHRRRHLGRRRHRERQLRLTSIIHRKPLEEERTKSRSRTTTSGVEDEETLKASAVVSQLTDPVEDKIDDFLQDNFENNNGESLCFSFKCTLIPTKDYAW